MIGYANYLLPQAILESICNDNSRKIPYSASLKKVSNFDPEQPYIYKHSLESSANPELRIADNLSFLGHDNLSSVLPCTVIIDDINSETINLTIDLNGKIYRYPEPVKGLKYYINDLLGDAPYLLEYGLYENAPKSTTIENYLEIPALQVQLSRDATDILKKRLAAIQTEDAS